MGGSCSGWVELALGIDLGIQLLSLQRFSAAIGQIADSKPDHVFTSRQKEVLATRIRTNSSLKQSIITLRN